MKHFFNEKEKKLKSLRLSAQNDIKDKTKSRQKTKFDKLFSNYKDNRLHPSADRWVLNLSSHLSSHQLSVSQTSLLAKGLNFAPSPASVPTSQMVSLVESVLKNIPTGEADKIRLRTINLLRDYRPTKSNLSIAEQQALKELKKNDNLLILPADKGRATVVMDREKYDDKLSTMLADTATYEKLKRDPAPALERRMNSILLALNRKGSLHTKLYEKLRSSAGRNPLLYGLPKVHKPQIPLRPIVSFLQSPTYELSKHLSRRIFSLL